MILHEDADAVEGDDGWLFLNQSSNDAMAHVTGRRPVDASVADEWEAFFASRAAGFANSATLISPEKICVFPDKLGDVRLDPGRLAIRLARQPGVFYPVEQLSAGIDGFDTYPATDTHFNDAGSLVCVRLLLGHFGLDWSFEPRWRNEPFTGDLGAKITPPRPDSFVRLANAGNIACWDNGIRNKGRILLYRNGDAPFGRAVIFGDSFSGQSMARVLAVACREVIFFHSVWPDAKKIAGIAPDYLIFEMAERFLRFAPRGEVAFETFVAEKYASGQRPRVARWFADASNPTLSFIDPTCLV